MCKENIQSSISRLFYYFVYVLYFFASYSDFFFPLPEIVLVKEESFLRRSNVKVVDVEARSWYSTQRGGNGEERHSQGVVTACISYCHEEHCWPNHTYRKKTQHGERKTSTSSKNYLWFSCDISVPYQQGRRPSWHWLWGSGRFPEDNQQTGHSAQRTQRSPSKAELTVYRSVVDRTQFYIHTIITCTLSARRHLTLLVLFYVMVPTRLESTHLFSFSSGKSCG